MGNNKNVFVVSCFVLSLMCSFGVLAIDVDSCDTVINESGVWNVTGDLFALTGDCIEISSDDVVLDCGDFVLDGDGVVDASGIVIFDVENVTVRNCGVEYFDAYGVLLDGVEDSVFEDLVLDGNGIDYVNEHFDKGGLSLISSSGNFFDNVVVMNDWWDNLYLNESFGNTFENSVFEFAYNTGITLLLSDENVFDNVTISVPYFDGVDVLKSHNNVLKNSFISGADDGGEGGVGIFLDACDGNLFYRNVFDNSVNADVYSAGVDNVWNDSVGNYWTGFSDSCDDVDDDGFCDDVYDFSDDVIAIDYLPFDNMELVGSVRTIEIDFNFSDWANETTDFSEFSDEELEALGGVVFVNEYGQILFGEDIEILRSLVLDGNIVISEGVIFVNSLALVEFNVSAELRFYGLSFVEPMILKDGVICEDCVFDYSDGVLVFSVSGFSEYSVEEGYVEPVVEKNSGSSQKDSGGWGGCSQGFHIEYVGGTRCIEDVVEGTVDEEVIVLEELGDVVVVESEDGVMEFESVITGNVIGDGEAGSWKVALGMVVLVLVVAGLVKKKKVNVGAKKK